MASWDRKYLNQRLNDRAAKALRLILNALLLSQLNQSISKCIFDNQLWNRIRILDSTSFQLPDSFADNYPGSGGSSNTAGVKIQLEYDLLSGKFLHVQSGEGSHNDKVYGSSCLEDIQDNDLFLRDLGYFDLHDLNQIRKQNAFFVSRIKLNIRVYIKNPTPETFANGTVKKQSEYTQIRLEKIMDRLEEAQTIEIPMVYCGMHQKLSARLICYHLTDE